MGAGVWAARRGGGGGSAAYYLRNVWNFDALKRCSCVLRAISFYNVCLFLCLLLFACFTYKYSILFYISGGIFKFSGRHFQLSILLRSIRFYPKKEFNWKHGDRCQNRDFSYPDRIFVRIRDFQAKSWESRRDQDGSSVMDNEIRFLIRYWNLKVITRITTAKRLHMNVMCGRVLEFLKSWSVFLKE